MQAGVILSQKYRLVSLLGQGGMGSVWKAEHLSLQAPVAVKLIDPEIAQNAEALARFHREARSAAALRSPHVVQILDHGVDDDTQAPFIVMEMLEGESLAQRLERCGRLSLAQTTKILVDVGRALNRAHAAGIVHRDLKPDNIFLVKNDEEEVAKVLDFGIAKTDKFRVGDAATATGMVMGTAYYMSPEQIKGEREVDHRTDLWALGVIAYECLSGQKPFVSETLGGLVLRICTEPPPIPSTTQSVPIQFDAWFAKATARSAVDRFQSARELVDALRNLDPTLGPNPTTGPQRSGGTLIVDTNDPLPSDGSGVAANTQNPVYRTTSDNLIPAKDKGSRTLAFAALASVLVLGAGAAGVWLTQRGPIEDAAAVDETSTTAAAMEGVATAPAPTQPPTIRVAPSPSPSVSASPPEDERSGSTVTETQASAAAEATAGPPMIARQPAVKYRPPPKRRTATPAPKPQPEVTPAPTRKPAGSSLSDILGTRK